MSRNRVRVSCVVCGLVILGGCAKYSEEKAFKEEPAFIEEEITSVVLRTGEQVDYDDKGGRVIQTFTVIGVSANGESVRMQSAKVEEIRAISPPYILPENAGDLRFAEALSSSGHLIRFGPRGGKVASGVLSGDDRTNVHVQYPVGRVVWLRVTYPQALSRDEITRTPPPRVAEVVTFPAGRLVMFDSTGGRIEDASAVVSGFIAPGKLVSVPLDSILYCKVRRLDAGKTFIASFGVVVLVGAAVAAIVAATKQSCPFIYSYDGRKYVFDAEPLGGATTAGLARTDYSRLEYLQSVDGRYRLLVRNEVDETQYLDRMQLLYADHDPSLTPVADGAGNLMLISRISPPLEARDEHGTDLMTFLRARDEVAWETHMASVPRETLESTRHTITLRFLKPPGAQRATLVVHGGTTLWGSNMIRVMYELRGNNVDRWYEEADRRGPALYDLLLWLGREELYTLKVHVLKNGAWHERGALMGGGPLIHESQLVPLALSGTEGDMLVVQLRPPVGFWSFDQIAVTFDPTVSVPLTPLTMLTAVDQRGRDVSDLLSEEDGRPLVMPDREDETTVTIEAPPFPSGKKRSLFLASSGYYRLHLPKQVPEDAETIARLAKSPGEIVRFSAMKYSQWQKGNRAAASSVVR